MLDDDPGYTDSELKQRRDLLLALNLNCSLCYVKAGAWNEAKDCCEEALKLDGASEKAYFRRGQVSRYIPHYGVGLFRLSNYHFDRPLRHNPDSTTGKEQSNHFRKFWN